ncbi:phosphoenolpyruvate--protein phosphotransferase [Clostridium tagluense]|uniref:phosphoenolpyruvate--protein phosphotransferase n=1 Tax=Clostridium TaxID=1485 RepID=UPI0013E94950|nr:MULTISPECIES: phosphoenolpyruvate--protein phosphotransferase [Clostridium]MBU3128120.1 phosphoenolpyruvate--protein phosphotransferase [Clostridium tagluense]MBW9156632.1 phosphoenolpyruvate--protein phosphotransferase [Clostridium tagluense]MBZ9625000.1 phosphoenolpyruvate--protein phosphotransferase [Clostridium sp. FP2]MCB2311743.1 phosphoenolpyruvate--protein phosphotransferase [Clostridium tagluense]MCB2316535.1 phosphoenolpyruvate--protein phosphotransferase [Clostridium tagluense]
MLKAIGASFGIAIGRALVISEEVVEIKESKVVDSERELARFNNAVEEAMMQLEKINKDVKEKLGSEKAEIFEAHLFMLKDPEFIGSIQKKIASDKFNAEYSLKTVGDETAAIFELMENKYMTERAADIRDVSKRVLNILMGIKIASIAEIQEECILIAKDLTPSDTAQIDKTKVLALVTEIGGKTAHTCIIARSLELPAVVGVGASISKIKDGDLIIVDGEEGLIIINPEEKTLNDYKAKKIEFTESKNQLLKYATMPSNTLDGKAVELAANIGSVEDLESVLKNGAEAIGLFRTEFLYMSKTALPTEEEQFETYKSVLEKMSGKPVIIRTLDIGGDKKLDYLPMKEEMNPFLGYRAIRLCLDRTDIFITQLRALLRASTHGTLKIMFPMISCLQELRMAKKILEQCKNELKSEGVVFDENLQVGIMIEIPSAALISDILAKEVDFFSIGTNDLIQYTTAVDRMNEKISYLYDFYHPGVLRLIKTVIDNGHKAGIMVGMCGEMAGDTKLIPLLLGFGLDELSMSASSILRARKTVTNSNYEDCVKLSRPVLSFGDSDEIKEFLKVSTKA